MKTVHLQIIHHSVLMVVIWLVDGEWHHHFGRCMSDEVFSKTSLNTLGYMLIVLIQCALFVICCITSRAAVNH